MDPESEKPLRLLVNPFAIWTQLAFKTGEAMLATAHAAAVRANTPPNATTNANLPRVAVIPTADAPPLKAPAPAAPPVRPARKASKAARFKSARAKLRSKANAKRRSRR